MTANIATFSLKGKENIWWEDMKNVMFISGSTGCALAMKFGRDAKAHEVSKTQKSFGEIPLG